MGLFTDDQVNLELLKQRAFNYRWASVEPGVIPLTAADPDFPVAPEIAEDIAKYAETRYFSYGPPEGYKDFKMAISDWYGRRFNVSQDPDLILPVNSAAHGLFIVAGMIAGAGDEVIIPDPVDFLFRKSVEHAGAMVRTCRVNKETGDLDMEELDRLISSHTKAIFICNPNNPLGKRLSKEHLNAIIRKAIASDLWVVSDEIWADISFNGKVTSLFDPELDAYDKKIIVSGLSKNFALAGMRAGYILTQQRIVFEAVLASSLHQTTAFGLPVLSQVAGAAAFNKSEYWLDQFLVHLGDMKQITEKFILESSLFEEAHADSTYLLFPKIVHPEIKSLALVDKIRNIAKVALVPGGVEWFESASEGHVRICYATSKGILEEAIDRMLKIDRREI